MSVIDDIKQRTDISDIAGQYTQLTKAGRYLKGLCPFHTEKHGSFFVYTEQQSWHCFGACNTGGDVFSLVMKKEGITFSEALRLLGERAGIVIPSMVRPEVEREANERIYQANEAASLYFHHLLVFSPEGERARSYVSRRGLSEKSIADFQLGYCLNSWDSLKYYLAEKGYSEAELVKSGLISVTDTGSHDRFRNRLVFPIKDARGRTTGFGARVLDDSLPKYLNSPETPIFDKSGTLYGLNLAREAIRRCDRAVIVEGYLDVITAHQHGFANVVASMGTSTTDKQVSAVKRLTKNLVFALDADAAGEEATTRAVGYENILGNEVKVALLPQGKDPDDVIREFSETWQRLVEEAEPMMDYSLRFITAGLDFSTARDKSMAVERLLPLINGLENIEHRDHYMQLLAQKLGMDPRKLDEVTAFGRSGKGRPKTTAKEVETGTAIGQELFSSPVEEYCLALLLQHPELKTEAGELLPDYFENSENREIYNAFILAEDVSSARKGLDGTVWEHFDRLVKKELPSNTVGQRLYSCILRLKEKYLRLLVVRRKALLASETTKGEEQDIDLGRQLKEVFIRKSSWGQKLRRDIDDSKRTGE
jgi:DNA primase